MPQVVTFDVDDRGQRAPARGVGEFVRGRQADEKKPRRSEAFSISVHGLRNETFRSKPIHDARIGSKVLWLIAAPTSALSSDQRDCGKGGCWSPKPSIRRAIGCFRAAGFQVEPYPVAFKTGGPSHSFSPYATGSGAFYLLNLAVKYLSADGQALLAGEVRLRVPKHLGPDTSRRLIIRTNGVH
jgi:hypothetical protein